MSIPRNHHGPASWMEIADWHVDLGIVAVACVGRDMIRVWPSPLESLWGGCARLTDEHVQYIANHPLKRTCGESPRTTKLYDRTNDAISLDEIERTII